MNVLGKWKRLSIRRKSIIWLSTLVAVMLAMMGIASMAQRYMMTQLSRLQQQISIVPAKVIGTPAVADLVGGGAVGHEARLAGDEGADHQHRRRGGVLLIKGRQALRFHLCHCFRCAYHVIPGGLAVFPRGCQLHGLQQLLQCLIADGGIFIGADALPRLHSLIQFHI